MREQWLRVVLSKTSRPLHCLKEGTIVTQNFGDASSRIHLAVLGPDVNVWMLCNQSLVDLQFHGINSFTEVAQRLIRKGPSRFPVLFSAQFVFLAFVVHNP
eukprot:TRINITY_DN9110_c0_g1_i1.p2 TRINITY_DN9110_c0_g1~~TRINITY_DN9110_c0_g1_i1.p2  ORF type:complete len:101 (+),score=1.69 TRINITY_DN9110_c0_g1_i1:526-828(+)